MVKQTYESVKRHDRYLRRLIELNVQELLSPILVLGDIADEQIEMLRRHHQVVKVDCPHRLEDLKSFLDSTSRKYETIISLSLLSVIDRPTQALEFTEQHCKRYALNYRHTFTEWLLKKTIPGFFVKSIMITRGLNVPRASKIRRHVCVVAALMLLIFSTFLILAVSQGTFMMESFFGENLNRILVVQFLGAMAIAYGLFVFSRKMSDVSITPPVLNTYNNEKRNKQECREVKSYDKEE
jgi:hypothetical protein